MSVRLVVGIAALMVLAGCATSRSEVDVNVAPLSTSQAAATSNGKKVLISTDFAYWGGSGPQVPSGFRDFGGKDICSGRGHQNRFEDAMRDEFIAWLRSLNERGYIAAPLDWPRSG